MPSERFNATLFFTMGQEMKKHRSAVPIFFALTASLAVVISACSKAPAEKPTTSGDQSIPVTVGKVEVMSLDQTLPVVGTLFPKDEAMVSAEVEGQLEKTLVDFGDRLKAGQEIALIDTTTYDALAKQAAANLAKAQANAVNSENDLKRTQELRKNNIASDSDLDKARAEAEQKRAEIKSAEAEAAIAQLHLQKSHVKAPFDSAVADRIGNAGDFVKTGSPLFRVVNDKVFKYIVQAPEKYAGLVRKDQLVLFNVDAYPGETFEGRVLLISPQVNSATRAFAFGALVQNPDLRLKASSFARGELILQKNVPTTVTPLEAVLNFAGVTRVFVVENGLAISRDVKIGRVVNGKQEILSGLKVGETIVLTGQSKIRDGSKIRLREMGEKIADTNSLNGP